MSDVVVIYASIILCNVRLSHQNICLVSLYIGILARLFPLTRKRGRAHRDGRPMGGQCRHLSNAILTC